MLVIFRLILLVQSLAGNLSWRQTGYPEGSGEVRLYTFIGRDSQEICSNYYGPSLSRETGIFLPQSTPFLQLLIRKMNTQRTAIRVQSIGAQVRTLRKGSRMKDGEKVHFANDYVICTFFCEDTWKTWKLWVEAQLQPVPPSQKRRFHRIKAFKMQCPENTYINTKHVPDWREPEDEGDHAIDQMITSQLDEFYRPEEYTGRMGAQGSEAQLGRRRSNSGYVTQCVCTNEPNEMTAQLEKKRKRQRTYQPKKKTVSNRHEDEEVFGKLKELEVPRPRQSVTMDELEGFDWGMHGYGGYDTMDITDWTLSVKLFPE